jgi:hypothetical protein
MRIFLTIFFTILIILAIIFLPYLICRFITGNLYWYKAYNYEYNQLNISFKNISFNWFCGFIDILWTSLVLLFLSCILYGIIYLSNFISKKISKNIKFTKVKSNKIININDGKLSLDDNNGKLSLKE